jgi:hypothetical protein
VNGHPFVEGRDLFGKLPLQFSPQAIRPLAQDSVARPEKPSNLVVSELLCELEGREAGIVKDFIGVGVSDPAEESRICVQPGSTGF